MLHRWKVSSFVDAPSHRTLLRPMPLKRWLRAAPVPEPRRARPAPLAARSPPGMPLTCSSCTYSDEEGQDGGARALTAQVLRCYLTFSERRPPAELQQSKASAGCPAHHRLPLPNADICRSEGTSCRHLSVSGNGCNTHYSACSGSLQLESCTCLAAKAPTPALACRCAQAVSASAKSCLAPSTT